MIKLALTILLIYFAYKFFFEGRLFLKYPNTQHQKENLRERREDPLTTKTSKKEDYIDYEEIE